LGYRARAKSIVTTDIATEHNLNYTIPHPVLPSYYGIHVSSIENFFPHGCTVCVSKIELALFLYTVAKTCGYFLQ
jgi:hypothetical protein